tara:strand:- start:113 stop:319 length:207 start_codon:yes stop_codon:yes gene_type:complete
MDARRCNILKLCMHFAVQMNWFARAMHQRFPPMQAPAATSTAPARRMVHLLGNILAVPPSWPHTCSMI